MKASVVSALALFLGSAAAVPTEYGPPKGGWESVNYGDAGKNLPSYPAPPGGYESVKYPPGTGSNGGDCKALQKFDKSFLVIALGDQVVNGTAPNVKPTPGPKDAVGIFKYDINGKDDVICYDLTLVNVKGAYRSPAKTATHIHQGVRGGNGPPRIAFPNPEGNDRYRNSKGCLKGPFTTGVKANGKDTGTGFKVQQILDNPAGFFGDSHTKFFVPGVVRGQLA